MPNANIVILMGNATRDPELKFTQGNVAIASWGIAVNRKWKGGDGEQKEETAFVECTAFRGLAEVIGQYLRKGAAHYVQGYLKLDQWQDKEGNKRSKLGVVVDQFQFCDKPPASGQPQTDRAPKAGQQAKSAPPPSDDNIPF